MKSTFNICFYAKKDKQKANGAYPLFARITVDGMASRFNTKLDVLPSIWDGKMGKATGRTSEASRINRMLDDINASLNTIYHEMQRRDNYVTAEKVKNEFLGHSESHETILSLFQKHNDDVKQLAHIQDDSNLPQVRSHPPPPCRVHSKQVQCIGHIHKGDNADVHYRF